MHNPTIVQIRSLHRRKGRREQGAFLVEGVRIVADAFASHARFTHLIVGEYALSAAGDMLVQQIEGAQPDVSILTVPVPLMHSLAETEAPQGLIAVVQTEIHALPRFDAEHGLVLVLDGLRDPGNVGTLIRTAAAAGADAVMLAEGASDAYAPKVVRAAMGAHFRIPVFADQSWDAIRDAIAPLPVLVGADATAETAYDAIDWNAGAALIIGHEDHGLSASARAVCRGLAAIPMANGVESLNAAVSGAVVLFEARRRRRAARDALT
jgi:TrmH family RNA methyltransferase